MNRVAPITFAAAVTPLRDDGDRVDEEAFPALLAHYAAAGLNGILALGTTGEGILLSADERRWAAECALAAAADDLRVFVHCGAQSTAETVALAAHAAEHGADGVAVIGPPYFALDDEEQFRHFAAAAAACNPLPFYLYEFAARTGYAVPLSVIERLRECVPNLAGLKVSDTPFERFEEYLVEGLEVFVGPEALIARGLERGAAGAVSGLAGGLPVLVKEAVAAGTREATERVARVRAILQAYPFQAALKVVLGWQGLPVRPDVRAPLRALSRTECMSMRDELDSVLGDAWAVPAEGVF